MKRTLSLLLGFIIAFLISSPVMADDLVQLPVSQTIVFDSSKGILDIGFDGKDKYVSVGKNGSINFSSDGQSWENVYSGTDLTLLGVDYGRNKFVAVGYNGAILISGNGKGWRKVGSQSQSRLNEVKWGKYGFVAVGDYGTILISEDGMEWKSVDSGTGTNLEGIVWSGEKYVAVGENGVIVTSDDGTSWQRQVSGTSKTLWAVTWNGKEFTAAGDTILTSTDSINWTDRMPGNNQYLFSVAANDSRIIVIGDFGRLFSSTDGVSWTPGYVTATGYITGIIWCGDRFLLGDESGRIYTSSDGLNWSMAACSARVITLQQAVIKTVPSNMEEDIKVGKPIEINFAAGFSFDPTAADIRITDPSGKQLGKDIVVSPDMSSISIFAPLKSNTTYQVTLGEGAAIDTQNNPSKEYVFSFKTAVSEPVQAVQKTVPNNGETKVDPKKPIDIYFSSGFKFDSSVSEITITDSNGRKVTGMNISIANDKKDKLSILASLKDGTEYTIKLSEGSASDSQGTISKEYSFKFRTARKTAQAIQKTSPANGRKNVRASSPLKVYFKPGFRYNAMSTVTIKDATGKKISCKMQSSANSGIVTITASLAKNKKYSVTLGEGLGYDNKGTYSAQYSFSFTTGSK